MGKSSRKNRARMPHANSKEEVIQRAREQAAANKPPLTEEETLTLDEARALLANKSEILMEAEQEKERLLQEISTRKAELQELERTCQARKETLLLNEEAQGIINQKEQILAEAGKKSEKAISDARFKAEKLSSEAADRAATQVEQAERTAKELLENARSEAESIVSSAKLQAVADAKEINEQRAAEDDAVLEDTAEEKAE